MDPKLALDYLYRYKNKFFNDFNDGEARLAAKALNVILPYHMPAKVIIHDELYRQVDVSANLRG